MMMPLLMSLDFHWSSDPALDQDQALNQALDQVTPALDQVLAVLPEPDLSIGRLNRCLGHQGPRAPFDTPDLEYI